ncbi:MAG: CCDC90 family protein [Helicobacteraceae bacterium]|nr:CCDC90 family protein [Helicobacteraceae bacterium]
MSILKFDTLSVVRELEGYGFEPRQAEGVVEVLKKTTEAGSEDLATKGDVALVRSDLKEVETRLDAKIDKVEAALDAKIDKVEAVLSAKLDILKWIGGVIAIAAVSAAVKYVFFTS